MGKKHDCIIRFMLDEKTWILSAVCLLAIVVLLLIAIAIGAFFKGFFCQEIIKDIVFPIATGAAFCVGFSLTIRHTSAVGSQTKSTWEANGLKKRELKQREKEFNANREQQRFNCFKAIVKSFDEGGLLTIDALENLVCEAKCADENHDIEKIQKIVAILCSFIKIHANKECVMISKLDSSWNGYSRNDKMPSFIIQKILNYMFPIERNNVFYSYREVLKFDLTSCNLQNMDLSKRMLQNVDFGGSAMHNVQMYKTTCINCNFWGTYLQGANLTCSKFYDKCNFGGAKMAWAKFCDSTFDGSEFNGADLTCSLLSNTILKDCSFKDAVLDGSDIYIQKTEGCEISEPKLFIAPYDLEIYLRFSFIYPTKGIVIKNKVIDSCKEIYDNPINRMERLIIYLTLLADKKCAITTSLERSIIQENMIVLLNICNKALKYAVIDESTGLNEQNYIIWTDKMKKLMETVNPNKATRLSEFKS